jgi:hypothetical protein
MHKLLRWSALGIVSVLCAETATAASVEEIQKHAAELKACVDAVNNSPRFAQLENKLWLGIDGDQPPTLGQIDDNREATPADSSAALAWSSQMRSCTDTYIHEPILVDWLNKRDEIIRAFSFGVLDYSLANMALFNLREQVSQQMKEILNKDLKEAEQRAEQQANDAGVQFWNDVAKAMTAHPGNDPASERARDADIAAAAAKAFGPR